MNKTSLVLLIILTTLLTACTTTAQKTSGENGKSVNEQPKQEPPQQPTMTTETRTETEAIPFEGQRVQDPNLDEGVTQVRQEGVAGIRTRTFKLTFRDGREETRTLEKDEVTLQPTTKIIADGIRKPEQIVYGTNTGARYHQDHRHVGGCHNYLRSSKIPMTISQAQARGLTPCQCGSCSW